MIDLHVEVPLVAFREFSATKIGYERMQEISHCSTRRSGCYGARQFGQNPHDEPAVVVA